MDIVKERTGDLMNTSITRITPENHDEYINKTDRPIVILYFSEFCVHCKRAIRSLFVMSQSMDGILNFGMCQVDGLDDFRLEKGIINLPSICVWQNGEKLEFQEGFDEIYGIGNALKATLVPNPNLRYVYADNAATTKISKTALEAFVNCSNEYFGNPSGNYETGKKAKSVIRNAKRTIANCLGLKNGKVIFTSGGTEADNMAICSAIDFGRETGRKHVIVSSIEHHAVLNAIEKYASDDFRITVLPVSSGGYVNASDVRESICEDTCLVSVMLANNEVGTIQPIKTIGALCKKNDILFHVDAVQAAGHIPVAFSECNIDYLAISAHKFNGPKGVGALLVNAGKPISRIIVGGHQEYGFRAGTENVPGIGSMAAALHDSCKGMKENAARIRQLKELLVEGLCTIPDVRINNTSQNVLPGILSVSIKGVNAKALSYVLDEAEGVTVSTGAACTSMESNLSHVLLAMKMKEDRITSTVRISLGTNNDEEDIQYLIGAFERSIRYLRKK